MAASATHTKYGFRYGPMEITRIHSDDKGGAWIEIKTERDTMQVRATPTGLLRIEKAAR